MCVWVIKEIYLAREHIKHVKMIADLTKNAWQQQTSTKQEMRRFSKKYLSVLYPELLYLPNMKNFFNTFVSLLLFLIRLTQCPLPSLPTSVSVSVIKFVLFSLAIIFPPFQQHPLLSIYPGFTSVSTATALLHIQVTSTPTT